MSEEQACLVRARSDSENSNKVSSFGSLARTMTYTEASEAAGEPGPPMSVVDNQDTNETGELIDYNEVGILSQFHEDALKQAGFGIAQLRVILATGFAVMGSTVELAAIPFILPSAEIELCIKPHEKSWLISISVIGLCSGAGWGVLASKGRRRALLSALAVNAVFATIAAFTPTYGTAMMARFCSALGSGGILPTVFTYLSELTPRHRRLTSLTPLLLFVALGGFYASGVASALVPYTGAETLEENKQHFSAWHRYLLLCTLPILASLICLIWTPESPRYLLEVGREHDACNVYQSIHSSNQILVCGKKNNVANSGSDYRLSELALPGKRRPPSLHHVRHNVKMFWHQFFQLFSHTYRSTTFTLGGTLILAMTLQFYIYAYTPNMVLKLENEKFEAARRIILNDTFQNQNFNRTIENIEYGNITFVNCTFNDIFLSHVIFKNCTFSEVIFTNIKTSYSYFENSLFVNSSIIDTDIDVSRDMYNCSLSDTTVRGMARGCQRELASRLRPELTERVTLCIAVTLATIFVLLARKTALLSAACVIVSPAIYFAQTETSLYIVEAILIFLLTLIVFGACLHVVESYPANLRCTAHGLIMSTAYLGALIGRIVGLTPVTPLISSIISAILSVACACVAYNTENTSMRLL